MTTTSGTKALKGLLLPLLSRQLGGHERVEANKAIMMFVCNKSIKPKELCNQLDVFGWTPENRSFALAALLLYHKTGTILARRWCIDGIV